MRLTIETSDRFICDDVDMCEPEPCLFLCSGGMGRYTFTIKTDALETLAKLRADCRPATQEDIEFIRLRDRPARDTCDKRLQVKHRDVSQWPEDLRLMWLGAKQAVVCELHPDCIRDETDDEICARMHARLAGRT